MNVLNIEIKARASDFSLAKKALNQKNARFAGLDHQVDTYFRVPNGRLKLREGNIENNLIHYCRADQPGPKESHVLLYPSQPGSALKSILTKALGILVVVDKKREIYFVENVKIHLDDVLGLGNFIEVEAIDKDGSIGKDRLLEQCNHFLGLFEIGKEDLVSRSYSDLLSNQRTS